MPWYQTGRSARFVQRAAYTPHSIEFLHGSIGWDREGCRYEMQA